MANALSQMYLMTDMLVPDSGVQRNYFETPLTVSGMEHHVNGGPINGNNTNANVWPPASAAITTNNVSGAVTGGGLPVKGDPMMMQWTATGNGMRGNHGIGQLASSSVGGQQQQRMGNPFNGNNGAGGYGSYPANGYHQEPVQGSGGASFGVQSSMQYSSDGRSFNQGPAMEQQGYIIQPNRIPSNYPMNQFGVGQPGMPMNSQTMNSYPQPQFYPDLSPVENVNLSYPPNNGRMPPSGPMPSGGHGPSQRMRPYGSGMSSKKQAMAAANQQNGSVYGHDVSVRYPQKSQQQSRQQQVVPVRASSTTGPVRATSNAFPFPPDMAVAPAPQPMAQTNAHNTTASNSYPPSSSLVSTVMRGQSPMYGQLHSAMTATSPQPMQMQYRPMPGVYPGNGRSAKNGQSFHGIMDGSAMAQPVQIQQIPNPNMRLEPFIQACDEELRMTLTTTQEPIIHPFKLEHNLDVSKHEFTLRADTYDALRTNPDLQLELKCFQHSEAAFRKTTNWPEGISVTVNGRPVAIPRGTAPSESRTPGLHRPLHIKELCLPPGKKNQIVIRVSACCCSHLFLLHIVHRPTVRGLVQGILKSRFLPAEVSVEKIRNILLGPDRINLSPCFLSSSGELIVTVTCIFNRRRIGIPARGVNCRHFDCWDLNNYLVQNSECNLFICPLCKAPTMPDQIVVDHFFWTILKQLPAPEPGCMDVDEILLDSNAQWKPSRSSSRLSEPPAGMKYHAISPATHHQPGQPPYWEGSSPNHHFPPQELPRSLSTGRSTPRGGPNSVGHPLSMASMTSDYGSPASLSAIVPVSPSAKSFPGSVSSCPQESPAASSSSLSHGARTPVPQFSQYSGVGSFPSTPKTPATSQPAPTATSLDFFDVFDQEGDTDAAALQFLDDMESSDFFSSLLDGPLADSQSNTTTFPNSTGNASDSGISNVSALTPAHSSEDEQSSFSVKREASPAGVRSQSDAVT